MRYVRAFFKALLLTLRGKAIDIKPRYPRLQAWLEQAIDHLDQVFLEAETRGINQAQREAITFKLDGRSWSLELILQAVRFHLDSEYPSLMNSHAEHHLTTFYALHFDDRYRVSALLQSDTIPEELHSRLRAFVDHFCDIPSSHNP